MSEKKQRELRVRCLVLDHDDTVVKSTPEINFPAFLRSLKDLRGTTMSYEQFVEYKHMSDIEVIVDMPAEYSGMVFGQFDEYAREIERSLKVDLIARDGVVKLIGEKTAVDRAKGVLDNLTELARRGNQISRQNVDYAISLSFDDKD